MGAYGVRVAVLVAVLGSAGLWSAASAQEPPPAGTMGIWFPDPADVGQSGLTLQDFLGGSIEEWFAYVLALVILMFRPQGLFGEKIIERV